MAKFNVRTDITNILSNSTIVGVFRHRLVAWCGSASKDDIEHIDSIIRKGSKVIRIPQPNIYSVIILLSQYRFTKHQSKHGVDR